MSRNVHFWPFSGAFFSKFYLLKMLVSYFCDIAKNLPFIWDRLQLFLFSKVALKSPFRTPQLGDGTPNLTALSSTCTYGAYTENGLWPVWLNARPCLTSSNARHFLRRQTSIACPLLMSSNAQSFLTLSNALLQNVNSTITISNLYY